MYISSDCIPGDGGNILNYNSSECSKISCGKCPRGMRRTSTEGECLTCVVGRYTDEIGESSCKNCESGLYNSEKGCQVARNLVKKDIIAQWYGSNKVSSWLYQDEAGQPCTVCPSGRYQKSTDTGKTDCDACKPGRFLPDSKNTTITLVKQIVRNALLAVIILIQMVLLFATSAIVVNSFYKNTTGQILEEDACKQCPDNTYTSSKGQSICKICTDGPANEAHTGCISDGNNDDTSVPIIKIVQSANEHRSLDITWTVPLNTNNNTMEIESIVAAINEETNIEIIEKPFQPNATNGRLDELQLTIIFIN